MDRHRHEEHEESIETMCISCDKFFEVGAQGGALVRGCGVRLSDCVREERREINKRNCMKDWWN